MRCKYCHNPELVLGKKKRLQMEDVMQFLKERQKLLDGVVISGGECTLSPELPSFIKKIRGMGYKIKLDTNGLRPDMLGVMLAKDYLDYVSLDYKAPRGKFEEVTGKAGFDLFRRSLDVLCRHHTPFEVRTTVHTSLIDEDDVNSIISDLNEHEFKGNYYIQNFEDAPTTIGRLPKQKRRLNMNYLLKPKSFSLHTRNF